MNDRLYRTVDDRVIAGVCGGLAVRLAIDPSLVRIAYAVVALVTGIFPLLVLYVVMAAIIPEEPTGFAGAGRPAAPSGPDAMPGWMPPSPSDAWPPAASPAPPAGTAWPPPPAGAEPGEPTVVAGEGGGLPGAVPVAPPPAAASWAAPERREPRPTSPLPAVIGGLVLVALGTWFLLRDRLDLDIDWGIVGAAALIAVGVVVVVAAFARPRR